MNRHKEDDTGSKKKSRTRNEGEKWHQQLSPASQCRALKQDAN